MKWRRFISATSTPLFRSRNLRCAVLPACHLKHGESSRVTVEVPAQRLRYWDTQNKQYVVEPGDYEILIGAASDDIRLRLPMTITAK